VLELVQQAALAQAGVCNDGHGARRALGQRGFVRGADARQFRLAAEEGCLVPPKAARMQPEGA